MRTTRLLAALAISALVGAPVAATAGDTVKHDADNTQRNVRDRDSKTLTPMDQGENEKDLGITQQIRKAVVGNDGLSTNAKNVKIITSNGVVTLRGPVKTEQERSTVVAAAQKVAGVTKVDNQLEVEANK